jgi:rhodanese-related sulfurtransferase
LRTLDILKSGLVVEGDQIVRKIRKLKLSTVINLTFILLLLPLSGVLARKYVFKRSGSEISISENVAAELGAAESSGGSQPSLGRNGRLDSRLLQIGKQIALPDYDWAASKRTLILAIKGNCSDCEASSLFYQSVLSEVRSANWRLLVLMEDGEISVEYLKRLGIPATESKVASFNSLGISVTPSLIATNQTGVVLALWRGLLNEEQQGKVIGLIRGTIKSTVELMSPENLKATVKPLTAQELISLIQKEPNCLVVDTRERESFADYHVAGAKNIPTDELGMRARRELGEISCVVIHGVTGSLDQGAAKVLTGIGSQRVYVLQGTKEDLLQAEVQLVSGK